MVIEVLFILTKDPLKIFLSLNIWITFITFGLTPLILGNNHWCLFINVHMSLDIEKQICIRELLLEGSKLYGLQLYSYIWAQQFDTDNSRLGARLKILTLWFEPQTPTYSSREAEGQLACAAFFWCVFHHDVSCDSLSKSLPNVWISKVCL